MSMDAIAEIKARRAAFLDCVETLRKSTAKRDSDEYNREWTAYWKSEAAFKNAVLVSIDSLLAEVEALRTRLTLTPEKVEAAAAAAHRRWATFYEEDVPWEDERKSVQKIYRISQRAALLAAGMTDAALDAAEEGK